MPQAIAAETLIHVFERGLFDGLLAVGRKLRDTLLQAHGDGDQGDVIRHHDQPLDCSAATVGRSRRNLFGERRIKAAIGRSSPDWKSSVILRSVNAELGLTADRYSPLLQEFFRRKQIPIERASPSFRSNSNEIKTSVSEIKADSLRITSENRFPMVIDAEMRALWPLRSHARTSVIPRTGSANAHHACVRLIVLLGNTKVTPQGK